MDRSLTLGATGGTFGAIALRLLADLSGTTNTAPLFPFDCPICPESYLPKLDPLSVLVGLLVGLSIGPCLDLINIIRQSWRLWVRERLAALAHCTLEGKYRTLEGKYRLV